MEKNNTSSGNSLADFSAQITAAIQTAAPSIVAIDARPRVATSGIVWRAGGVIVSTNHTIRLDENITVAFEDGRTTKATLVGRDAGTDLAVLKIDDEAIVETLKPADVIETEEIKVGNVVLAIGNSGGGVTASFGIVNQISGAWRTWRGDEIERFISLDLAVYLGFSGGALIDANGKVLGVNTSAFGRGLALTIPSETVNRVVDAILSKGSVARPYLGIGTQAVALSESLREKLNLEQSSGLMMLNVEADGAAEKAGVLLGDVLLSIDEKPTLEPSDVQAALWGKAAGEAINAKILRGGELKEIEIVLGFVRREAKTKNAAVIGAEEDADGDVPAVKKMANENDTVNVLIVASSAIVRAGLESVLRTRDGFFVMGGGAEISAAPSVFSIIQTADVVLVNVEREKDFDDLLIVLSEDSDEVDATSFVALLPIELQNSEHAIRALQSGARGILPHDASANEIIAAVAAAANGLVSLLPEMIENLLSSATIDDLPDSIISGEKEIFSDEMIETLTARETEILEMLTDGASNKTIAFQLNISEHTVKFHVASIFGKLGVNTRTEAVTQALRRGLILL